MRGPIAFPTSNFIARELGYSLGSKWRRDDPSHPFLGGWAECAAAVRDHFAPQESYAQRFDELLSQVQAAGFEAVEIWSGHLNPQWATDHQVTIARELLLARGIQVVGYHGYLGDSLESASRACEITATLGATLLTGGGGPFLETNRPLAIAILRDYGVRLAIENHPEHGTPTDLLAQVGDGADGSIGVNLDTGWWGTLGYDPVKAIDELAANVLHAQLKDVVEAGGHDPCRLGDGCVPIKDCLRALRDHGYTGAYSIEYLAPGNSPLESCRLDRQAVQSAIDELWQETRSRPSTSDVQQSPH